MSVPLEYPNKCAKCGSFMNAGTPVDFFKEGKNYVYTHAGDCSQAVPAKKHRRRFDIRCCPDPTCYAGNPGYAFLEGHAPPRCQFCGKPWLAEVAA